MACLDDRLTPAGTFAGGSPRLLCFECCPKGTFRGLSSTVKSDVTLLRPRFANRRLGPFGISRAVKALFHTKADTLS